MNLYKAKHRRLDAAEGKGKPAGRRLGTMHLLLHLRKREGHRSGVSVRGEGIDPGSTRIAQPKQLRDLVKGFAGRIVKRRAHIAVSKAAPLLVSEIEMGVPPGDHQRQGSGPGLSFLLRQQHGMNVAFQVVNGNQRLAQGKGKRLGVRHAYQERTCQAWAFCDRDRVKVGEPDAGFLHSSADDGDDVPQVLARGEFRNHSTIGCVDRDLRGHNAGQDAVPALHDGGCRFIAGAFNRQHQAFGLTHVSIVVEMEAREAAAEIVARLRAAGHQAYFVGGCVRDVLLGRQPEDFDVATSARPEQVLAMFEKTQAVGAHFGVILVLSGDENVTEVATFRSDGVYSDGRHPDAVRFSDSPEEDVKRRDFTINGMMLDPDGDRVLDVVGGLDDLRFGVVRAIGDPVERFTEDKLRMLRGVRFAARFNFALEPVTAGAIRALASEVHQVSRERVRDELTRMLTEGHARRAFELLDSTGLLPQVLPEAAKMKGVAQPPQYHPEGDVWVHTLLLLDGLEAGCPMALGWGALLHDVGKPATFRVAPDRIRFDGHVEAGVRIAEEICRRLRFPNHETEQILLLIANHMRFADAPRMKQSTLKRFFRLQHFDQHLALHRLDCLASHGLLALYDFARERYASMPEEQVRPSLLVTGRDLIEAGYQPGPEFSKMLSAAEDAQLEGTVHNREEALALIRDRWPL